MTKLGISNSALNLSVVTRGSEWIIDSGATNHMTCDPYKFTSFSSNCSKTFIINANGVLSPIEGVGTVCLSPSLSIFDVLFVSRPSITRRRLTVVERVKDCII